MGPPPIRERHNAKARGSVVGGSHKKRKRPRHVDQDYDLVSPTQLPEHEEGRGKMSSKKRKRLDSYVSKKLKNEERFRTLELLASLAPSQSTSAALASSSTLGQNPLRPSSAKERTEKREDKLVRKGIEKVSRRIGDVNSANESDSEGSSSGGRGSRKGKERAAGIVGGLGEDGVSSTTIPAKPSETIAGSRSTRSKAPKDASWNPNLLPTQPQSESSDFDSSDLAYDSPGEAGPSTPRTRLSMTPPAPRDVVMTLASTPKLQERGIGGALKEANGEVPIRRRPEGEEDESEKEINASASSADEVEDEDDSSDETGTSGKEKEDEDNDDDEKEDEDEEEGITDLNGGLDGGAEPDRPLPSRKRALGFKDWARNQMGQVAGPILPEAPQPPLPSVTAPTNGKLKHPYDAKTPFVGPLGAQVETPASSLLDTHGGLKRPTARPDIARRSSVSEARMNLPIFAEEQAIIEAIRMQPVVIIAGETGSGKTTQVPQMLYEAGFGFKGSDDSGTIAITQPRRVAAVSLSARVKSELNLHARSSLVAHQIRYSSTTSSETAIKFMTDGVLLRELASDFLLSRYSVVIVDEAHERAVNTDVLIGVLSRVAKLREKMWRDGKDTRPLRIVIMSATLRIDDFIANPSLFSTPPPVIHIPAREHPVIIHFSRRTVSDYVTEAYKKVCKVHARLPVGAVLVFLTGQAEIQALCRKLERRYGKKAQPKPRGRRSALETPQVHVEAEAKLPTEDTEVEDVELGQQDDLAADVDDGAEVEDPEALDSDDEGIAENDIDEATNAPMHILPLYSLLPTEQQMLVFRSPPANYRLVIVATNVAETSLTIPGIRYVVDSGRAKERQYDPSTGVRSFQVSWISKASASQRAGRAGRTGPGHCYRLYSSALYEDHFEAFSKPEILRMPIEGVVLQMKSMNIDQVVNFPFPTPPDRFALKKAEDLLTHLGALSSPTHTRMIHGVQQAGISGGQVTELGKAMGAFPVSPRFAKMLVIGSQHGCLAYVVAIVACLSVGDPFLHEQSIEEGLDGDDEVEDGPAELKHIRSEAIREKEERKALRSRYFKAHSQFLSLVGGTSDDFKMLAAVGAYEYDPTPSFCAKNFLRPKAMQEIQQLRSQISNIAKLTMSRLAPPTDVQLIVLRQILTAGFIDQVAVRLDIAMKKPSRFTSCRNVPYRTSDVDEEVFIHPSSSLFHRPPPDFVVFQELVRTSKPWLKGVTKINPAWLSQLGKGMCSYSRPMEVGTKGGSVVKEVKEGEREVSVVPHFRGLGVDLPVVRMRQRREGTRWVLVDQ